MTTENDVPEDTESKPGKLPVILGIALAIALGSGGFFSIKSGMFPGFGKKAAVESKEQTAYDSHAPSANDVAFVPIPEVTVSLGSRHANRHLFFLANIEVPKKYEDEITHLIPRILDVFNSYLQAIEPADMEAANALFTIRAHLLRRVQIIVGNEKINDLLVLKFVLK